MSDNIDETLKEYGNFVKYNGDEALKKEAISMVLRQSKEEVSLYLWYYRDCCDRQESVLLDRYPLSKEIITMPCENCGTPGNVKLLLPIEFRLNKKDLTLKEIREDSVFNESHWQYKYITQILDNFCDEDKNE